MSYFLSLAIFFTYLFITLIYRFIFSFFILFFIFSSFYHLFYFVGITESHVVFLSTPYVICYFILSFFHFATLLEQYG